MKILYFSPHPLLNSYAQTGYATHMREVIRGLENLGHEVFPLIVGGSEAKVSDQNTQDLKVGGFKAKFKSLIPPKLWQSIKDQRLVSADAKAYQLLLSAIEKHEPDVIYERGYYLMRSGVKAAKAKGIPHMMEINAPFCKERPAMEGAPSWYAKAALKVEKLQADQTAVMSVVSSAIKDYYKQIHSIPEDKIHVIPNAVNADYESSSAEATELMKAWQWDEKSVVVGFVGSIFPYHGVDLLLETFLEMSDEFPQLRLLVVGDGQILPELRSKAMLSGKELKVVFTGKVDHKEVFAHMEAMDVCVMADSNWYGSPVKIFEYGLANKAIIAPDNVPVRDVMQHDVHALLTKNTKSDLRHHLKRLVEDEALRQKLAQAWKQKVLEQHLWKNVAKEVEQRLEMILNE